MIEDGLTSWWAIGTYTVIGVWFLLRAFREDDKKMKADRKRRGLDK